MLLYAPVMQMPRISPNSRSVGCHRSPPSAEVSTCPNSVTAATRPGPAGWPTIFQTTERSTGLTGRQVSPPSVLRWIPPSEP